MMNTKISARILLLTFTFTLVFTFSSNGSIAQEEDSTTQATEIFRVVEVISRVEVVNEVRVRTEPGTSGGDQTVIRIAQVGEEFEINPDYEWVQANGYTWIPIIIDEREGWVAQEGFVLTISERANVPVSQEEIDFVINSDPPGDATTIVIQDNNILATDDEGNTIAIWNWHNEVSSGSWVIGNSLSLAQEINSFEQLANMSMNEFRLNYQYQRGDQVQLVRSSGNNPNRIDDYWTFSVTRFGMTVDNIPVRGQVHPGDIRYPLGFLRRTEVDWGDGNAYVYGSSGIYLRHESRIENVYGSQIEFYEFSFLMPFENTEAGSRVVRFSMQADMQQPHGSGGSVLSYPFHEVFSRLDGMPVGQQIIFATNDFGYSVQEIYDELGEGNRETCILASDCALTIFLLENFSHATPLYNYAQTGEGYEHLIINEFGEILAMPIGGLIFQPPSIYGVQLD